MRAHETPCPTIRWLARGFRKNASAPLSGSRPQLGERGPAPPRIPRRLWETDSMEIAGPWRQTPSRDPGSTLRKCHAPAVTNSWKITNTFQNYWRSPRRFLNPIEISWLDVFPKTKVFHCNIKPNLIPESLEMQDFASYKPSHTQSTNCGHPRDQYEKPPNPAREYSRLFRSASGSRRTEVWI